MVVFGMTIKNKEAHDKINEIVGRLSIDDVIRNPFTSRTTKMYDMVVLSIEPIYQRFYTLFWLPLLIFLFFPDTWYGITGAIISGLMLTIKLWWWDRFYFFLFWWATKKGVIYLSPATVLERVMVVWDNKK